jgi:hypothetical protein
MNELGRRLVVVAGGLFLTVGLLFWIVPPLPIWQHISGLETCGWFPVFKAFDTGSFVYCTEVGRSRAVTGLVVMAAAAAWTFWALRHFPVDDAWSERKP